MGYTKPDFRIAKDKTFFFNGWNLPINSAYGTFTGYKNMVQYVVPVYPQTIKETLIIYVWSGIKWIRASYERYKKLYHFVVQKISECNLIGTHTKTLVIKWRDTFQSSAPYGKPHKITALKEVNKQHLARGDNNNLKWDSKKDGFTDRRYTKNIVY